MERANIDVSSEGRDNFIVRVTSGDEVIGVNRPTGGDERDARAILSRASELPQR